MVVVFSIFAEISTNYNSSCEGFLVFSISKSILFVNDDSVAFFLLIHLPVISIFLSLSWVRPPIE